MGGILPPLAIHVLGQAFRLLDEQHIETSRVGNDRTSSHHNDADERMDSKTAGDVYKSPFQKRFYRDVTHGPGYVPAFSSVALSADRR